jgi:hypothetical protein
MRLVAIGILFLGAATASAAEMDSLLARIKAVSKEGAGNQEAAAAWKSLVALGGDALFPTLKAFDDASAVSANWLRSAVNAVVEKEKANGKNLPAEKLETFVKDAKHSPISRRLAYEILCELDPKAPERLLPGMLNDPSGDIRRDAIAAELEKVKKLEGNAVRAEYERLFGFVRDQDQAEAIIKELDKFKVKPDVIAHFGIVTKWMLAGPFDSTKRAGFAKAYEPEAKVDLSAKYAGKNGTSFTWKPHTTTEKYGKVDLNKALEKHKDACAYAFTIIESETDRPIELRFGCICAIKVFLNGKELFAREEYHHGDRFDQYVAKGALKAGKNEILVKVCQNNQTEQWAQDWSFQFRICDATGGAVPVKVALP